MVLRRRNDFQPHRRAGMQTNPVDPDLVTKRILHPAPIVSRGLFPDKFTPR
jgi:hypothetical protein